jgi:hypothetical protein
MTASLNRCNLDIGHLLLGAVPYDQAAFSLTTFNAHFDNAD